MSLFEALGLQTDATTRDVKRAYKEKALKHHPDRPGGDPEAFKRVNEAYDLLIDDEQRQEYLRLLNVGSNASTLDQYVRYQFAQSEEQGIAKPSSKYERTCRNWSKGTCTSKSCLYRHYQTTESDKTRLNKVCHDYTRGYCRFGDECVFLHKGADGESANLVTQWVCSDLWRDCKAENHVLQHPRRCNTCGARRRLSRCKYPVDTTVKITGFHQEIVNYVKKHFLFFLRDGLNKRRLNDMVQKMSTIFMQGQLVPKVTKFYPSANCYHCVFQDGSFLIVPDKYLTRGEEKWQCTQCQFHNHHRAKTCGLCARPNPHPVQDWSPFCGTWKSATGDYYVNIGEHAISCSEQAHHYSGLKLHEGVLSYDVTLIDDQDCGNDDSSEENEEDDLTPLGEVRLVRDGARLKGDLYLRDGRTQSTVFTQIAEVEEEEGAASDSSSSFDSAESTEAREKRLKFKADDPEAYRRNKRRSGRDKRPSRRSNTPPRKRSTRERDERDAPRRSDKDRDRRDRDRDRGREQDRDRDRDRERERERERKDRDRDRDREKDRSSSRRRRRDDSYDRRRDSPERRRRR